MDRGQITPALEQIVDREGGYVHDPTDWGGETKYGISKRAYPHLDIKNLTREQAMEIYYRDYYLKNKLDRLPAPLQEPVLDWTVNSGKIAIKSLQRLIFVKDDGIIGPETELALKSANIPSLLSLYTKERVLFYARLVQRNPSHLKYLVGWLSRALSLG